MVTVMRPPGSPEELEHRRRLAVRRLQEGYTPQEIADFLEVDPSSVRRWDAAFRQQGALGLSPSPVPGRPRKLSHTQEKIVLRWLADLSTEHGFPTDLWTAARLAQLIQQEWGISLHPGYLCRWLRVHDLTPQKPQPAAREKDPNAVAAWLKNDWPRIKKLARRRHANLVIIDESGLLMTPLLRRSWAPRGQPPTLLVRASHREKVSVAAALFVTPRRDRLGLFFQTLVNGYFNSPQVADFMEALLHSLDGPVVALWDGGTMHKGDPIRALLQRFGPRLTLELLPPYAPELSPVEPLWRWLKYDRLCNFAPVDARQLNEMVLTELRAILHSQALLRSFFAASDLPIPRALLR